MADPYPGTERQRGAEVPTRELGREGPVWKETPTSLSERGGQQSQGSASDPSDLQGGSLGKVCFYEGGNCSATRAV